MNITLAIPKGKNVKKRIEKELSLANNIQNKHDRDSIQTGLTKILEQISDGKAYLWNGTDLTVFEYPLNDYIYYCDKTYFKAPVVSSSNRYMLVCLDANNCAIGELVGTKLTVLWSETSQVPRKHNKGGQSKERFQRGREQALIQWYKKVADKMKELSGVFK